MPAIRCHTLFHSIIVKLFLGITFLTVSLHAQVVNDIYRFLDSASNTTLLKQSQWGVFAAFTDNKEILLDFNGHKVMAPASNLKVLTSGVALKLLGSNFRYKTLLGYSGELKHGTIEGDLVIQPSGDPSFATTYFKDSLTLSLQSVFDTILSSLFIAGIHSINGDIVLDLSQSGYNSIPPYWPWIDIGNYYGTGISGLVFHDNLYYLLFKPGREVGDSVTILGTKPDLFDYEFINDVTTGPPQSGDNAYIYFTHDPGKLHVKGTIPIDSDTFVIKGAIPDPPQLFGNLLKSFLEQRGVHISGKVRIETDDKKYTSVTPLILFTSPPLSELVKIVNKISQNLWTEQLLVTVGQRLQGISSTSASLDILINKLNEWGIETDGLDLYDGSGLSRTNLISPRTLVSFLQFMSTSGVFEDYYQSFPVAGDTTDIGGFKRFGTGTRIANNARIKSGTINGVRAYTGYVHSRTGRLIAFSMIANNYNGRAREVDEIHKQIILWLSERE